MKTNDNEATVIQPPYDDSTAIATPAAPTGRNAVSSPTTAPAADAGKKKSVKKAPAVAGAGILLGSASALFMTLGNEESPLPPVAAAEEADDEAAPEGISLETTEETVAALPETSASDGMTFDEAFAAARAEQGPGSAFEWHGNVYATYTREEWSQMSDDQISDFYSGLHLPKPSPSPQGGDAFHFEDDDAPLLAEAVVTSSESEVEIVDVVEAEAGDVEIEILGVAQDISTGNGIGHLIVEDDDAFVVHVDSDTTVTVAGLSEDPLSSIGDTPDYLTEVLN